MCSAIDNFKEKLNGLMSTLQELSSAEQEAALSLLSSTLSSELRVLPQQNTNTFEPSVDQRTTNLSQETSDTSIQKINKVAGVNFTENSLGTTPGINSDSKNIGREIKERQSVLKSCDNWLEKGSLSIKPARDHFQCGSPPVEKDSFLSIESESACQVSHCSSSESYLPCDSKPSSSFKRHDLQHRRVEHTQSCPILLSQQKEILPRSQKSSSPQKVCLSFQETQVSPQTEGAPLKKVCLLSHHRAGRKQSELPVFQQDEVPQKSAPPKPRATLQVVTSRREVDELPPISFNKERQTSEQVYLPSGESPALSGQNQFNQEKINLVEPTKVCFTHEKNLQKKQIDDQTHQQAQVSLMPIFSSRNETVFTHDQTIKISHQTNESLSKDKHLQQPNEVPFRANKTLQSSLFQQSQASDNGDATCPVQSNQNGRVPEKEDISQDQIHLPQTEEYSTSSTERLSQSEDGSLMSKSVLFSQASPVESAKHLSSYRTQDVQNQGNSSLQSNDLDDARLIVDECSVSSVDVVNISNAPPWEQDKMSMTQDLREATENLEKSLSRLKKQQELHFQQQQLRFGEHYVFSNDHSSELELLNKKLLLEFHDDATPLDAVRGHTIFHPCYSQRASNVFDQNLLVLELTQNSRCDTFAFNDGTTAPSIDLPNDFSEVLDYSLPARSERILDMHLPTDLTVVQDYPSKTANPVVSDKVISSFTEAFSVPTPETVWITEDDNDDVAQPTDLSVSTELKKKRSGFSDDLEKTVCDRPQLIAVDSYSINDTNTLCCDSRELAGLTQPTKSMRESLDCFPNRSLIKECSDKQLNNGKGIPKQKPASMKYITKNRHNLGSIRRGCHRKSVKRKNTHRNLEQQSTREDNIGSDGVEELECHDSVAESCSAPVDVVYDLSLSNVDLFEKSKKEIVQIHNSSSWNSSLMSDAVGSSVHIYNFDEPILAAGSALVDENITAQTIADSTNIRSGSVWHSTEAHPEDLTIPCGDAQNPLRSGAVLPSLPLQSQSLLGASSPPLQSFAALAPSSSPDVTLALVPASTDPVRGSRGTDPLDVAATSDLRNERAVSDTLNVSAPCHVADSKAFLYGEAGASELPKLSSSELSLFEHFKLPRKVLRPDNDSQDNRDAADASKGLERFRKRPKLLTRKPAENLAATGVHSRKKRRLKTERKAIKPLNLNTTVAVKKPATKVGHEQKHERKNGRYHCSYCGLEYLHKVSFVKHFRGHSGNSCSVCPSNFSSRKALRQHSLLMHSLNIAGTSYSCDHCSRTFTKRVLLYAHKAKHHTGPNQHLCGKCGLLLASLAALSQHLQQHSSTELPCGLCDATFSRRQQLLHHQQGHERNQCPLCGAACSSKKQLVQHTKTAHPTAPCALCTNKSRCTHHRCLGGVGSNSDWRDDSYDHQIGCSNNNDVDSGCDFVQGDNEKMAKQGSVFETEKNKICQKESVPVANIEKSDLPCLHSSVGTFSSHLLSKSQPDVNKPSSSGKEDLCSAQAPRICSTVAERRVQSPRSHTEVLSQVPTLGIVNGNHEPSSAVNHTLHITNFSCIEAPSLAVYQLGCREAIATCSQPSVSLNSTTKSLARREDSVATFSMSGCHYGAYSSASRSRMNLPPELRGPVHPCSRCPRVFPRPSLLREHEALHDGAGGVRCHSCDKSFTSRCGYRKHLASRQHVVTAIEEQTAAANAAAPTADGGGGDEEKGSTMVTVDESLRLRTSVCDVEDELYGNGKDEVQPPAVREVQGGENFKKSVDCDNLFLGSGQLSEMDTAMSDENSEGDGRVEGARRGGDDSSKKSTKFVKRKIMKRRKGMAGHPVIDKRSARIDGTSSKVMIGNKICGALIKNEINFGTGRIDDTTDKNINNLPGKNTTLFCKRIRNSASEGNTNETELKTADCSHFPKENTSNIKGGRKRTLSSGDNKRKRVSSKVAKATTCARKTSPFEKVSFIEPNYSKHVSENEISFDKHSKLIHCDSSESHQSALVSSTDGACDHSTVIDNTLEEPNITSDSQRSASEQERSVPLSGGASPDDTAVSTVTQPSTTKNKNVSSHELLLNSSSGDGNPLRSEKSSHFPKNILTPATNVVIPISPSRPPMKTSQPGLINLSNVYYAGPGCDVINVRSSSLGTISSNVCNSIADSNVPSVAKVFSVGYDARLSQSVPGSDTHCDTNYLSTNAAGFTAQLMASSEDQFPSEGVCKIVSSTVDDIGMLRHAVVCTSSVPSVVAPTSFVISVVSSTSPLVSAGLPSSLSSTPLPRSGLPSSSLSPPIFQLLSAGPPSSSLALSTPLPVKDDPSTSTAVVAGQQPLPASRQQHTVPPSPLKFQCSHCDYSTTRKYCLKRHIDSHFNRRRFVCEACGKAFHSLLNLKEHHAFLHSNQRNFHCDKCSQTFKNKSTLVRHVRQRHSNAKPYACHCGISFKRVTHLRRHLLVVHNESPKLQKRTKVILVNDSINCKDSTIFKSPGQA